MNNKINLKVKGYIKIYRNGKLIHEQPNTIQSGAYSLIMRSLAGEVDYINQISVYKVGALLAAVAITQKSYPTTSKVQFIGIFDEPSFNDTFDDMRLEYSGGTIFSKVTGLSITKDNLSQISIEWTLEFTITGVSP